jgi:hypothetical protein
MDARRRTALAPSEIVHVITTHDSAVNTVHLTERRAASNLRRDGRASVRTLGPAKDRQPLKMLSNREKEC